MILTNLTLTDNAATHGLTQIVQTATRGRYTLDLFLTNRDDIVICTVVKSCLNTDHLALMVKLKDKLARALQECDWSCVTGAAEIDNAYHIFLVNVHRLIQQTIPCHKVTLTKSTPPHITPLLSLC